MEKILNVERAFDKYSDMVYRLAFARVKNKYDADDILQEVFLRYMRTKKIPQSEEHTKALLIRITINCSKSTLTSPHRKRTEPLNEQFSVSDGNFDTLDAVLRLPLKYRTVVHLYYYCGYSAEEIASILSLKYTTVKSQLFRARKMLKTELEGDELDVRK